MDCPVEASTVMNYSTCVQDNRPYILYPVFESRAYNRLTGMTAFTENRAWNGGAIFNREVPAPYDDDEEIEDFEASVITYPNDTVFINNSAEVRAVCSKFCQDVSCT